MGPNEQEQQEMPGVKWEVYCNTHKAYTQRGRTVTEKERHLYQRNPILQSNRERKTAIIKTLHQPSIISFILSSSYHTQIHSLDIFFVCVFLLIISWVPQWLIKEHDINFKYIENCFFLGGGREGQWVEMVKFEWDRTLKWRNNS